MQRTQLLKAFVLNAAQIVSKTIDKTIHVIGKPLSVLYDTLKSPALGILFGAAGAVVCMKGMTSAAISLAGLPVIAFVSNLAEAYKEQAALPKKPADRKESYQRAPSA